MIAEELQAMIADIDRQIADTDAAAHDARTEIEQLAGALGDALADGETARAKGIEATIAKLRALLDALPTRTRALQRRREKAAADLAAAQLDVDRGALATLEAEGIALWRQLDADLARTLATFDALTDLDRRAAILERAHRNDLSRHWASVGRLEFLPDLALFAKRLRVRMEKAPTVEG